MTLTVNFYSHRSAFKEVHDKKSCKVKYFTRDNCVNWALVLSKRNFFKITQLFIVQSLCPDYHINFLNVYRYITSDWTCNLIISSNTKSLILQRLKITINLIPPFLPFSSCKSTFSRPLILSQFIFSSNVLLKSIIHSEDIKVFFFSSNYFRTFFDFFA